MRGLKMREGGEEGNEMRQKMTERRSKCGKMRETGKEENVGGEEEKMGYDIWSAWSVVMWKERVMWKG